MRTIYDFTLSHESGIDGEAKRDTSIKAVIELLDLLVQNKQITDWDLEMDADTSKWLKDE